MFKGHKMSSSETCCSLAFSFHSSTKMKSDRLHGEPKPSMAVHLSQNQLGWGFPASYFIRLAKYTSVTQNSVVVLLRGINISAGMQGTTTNILCSDMKTKELGFFSIHCYIGRWSSGSVVTRNRWPRFSGVSLSTVFFKDIPQFGKRKCFNLVMCRWVAPWICHEEYRDKPRIKISR